MSPNSASLSTKRECLFLRAHVETKLTALGRVDMICIAFTDLVSRPCFCTRQWKSFIYYSCPKICWYFIRKAAKPFRSILWKTDWYFQTLFLRTHLFNHGQHANIGKLATGKQLEVDGLVLLVKQWSLLGMHRCKVTLRVVHMYDCGGLLEEDTQLSTVHQSHHSKVEVAGLYLLCTDAGRG